MIKRRFLTIITILILLTLSSCNKEGMNGINESNSNDGIPIKNGILSFYSTTPDTMNPLITKNKFVKDYSSIIFDKLVSVTDKGVCQPSIATNWEQSKDGLIWIFKIRNDLKWHDDVPITPIDIVFTIKTIISYGDLTSYKWNVDNISDVSVFSQDTIKVELKIPDAFIPEKMYIPIVPEHYYTGNGLIDEDKKFKPIGSGPFKFVSYEPAKEIKLIANDDWKTIENTSSQTKSPYIREIKIMLFESTTNSEKALNDNKTDLTFTDSSSVLKYIGRNDVNIIKYNNTQFQYIAFNVNGGIFMEKYMRQCVSRALDIQSIIKETVSNDVTYATIPILPENYIYETLVKSIYFDINKAKDILMQNGWGFNGEKVFNEVKGRANNIEFSILVNEDNLTRIKIAEKIKANMEQLGFKVNINSVKWEQYLPIINSGTGYDMAIMGVNVPDIPDISFMYSSTSPFNSVKYKNDDMDKNLQNLQMSGKQDDKTKIIKDIIKIAEDDVPYLGLYYGNDFMVINKRIGGDIKPFQGDKIYDITKWNIPIK